MNKIFLLVLAVFHLSSCTNDEEVKSEYDTLTLRFNETVIYSKNNREYSFKVIDIIPGFTETVINGKQGTITSDYTVKILLRSDTLVIPTTAVAFINGSRHTHTWNEISSNRPSNIIESNSIKIAISDAYQLEDQMHFNKENFIVELLLK